MKYCRYCGGQIADEAVICLNCGRTVNEQPAPQESSLNVLCLLGFIFSFISAIVGLVLSIIGNNQVKNTPDTKSKNFAKAGIIISSVMLGISVVSAIIAIIVWLAWFSWIFGTIAPL